MDEARVREIVREEIEAVRLRRMKAAEEAGFGQPSVAGLIRQIDEAVRDSADLKAVSGCPRKQDRTLPKKTHMILQNLQSFWRDFRVIMVNRFRV